MRRNLTGWLVLAVLSTSLLAFASDPPPPPPPPPPPADTTGSSSGGSGDSALRGNDALFDASPKTRKTMLSFFIGLPWGGYYGGGYGFGGFPIGVGARFYIPIVHNGFIPTLNDSFGIEFGGDVNGYINWGFGIAVPIEARWGFHLLPKLEVYGKAGFGLGAFIITYAGYTSTNFYGYGVAEAGVVYNITDVIALRAEVGYPAIKIGIGIAF